MRIARTLAILLLLVPMACVRAQDTTESATAREVTAMLRQFLDDASTGNAAGFDKFFADDVIYTRSAGAVTNKADIMKSVRGPQPATDSKTVYLAEDIAVHDYGDTAVVAFRLVGRTEHKDGKVGVMKYRNTGVFLRRGGRWQVVAWQSTKIPDAAASR